MKNFFSEQNTTEQNIIKFQCTRYGLCIDFLMEDFPYLEKKVYESFYDKYKVQTLEEILPKAMNNILFGRDLVVFLKNLFVELEKLIDQESLVTNSDKVKLCLT